MNPHVRAAAEQHHRPEVLAARRRGVWFDVGNGQNGHIRWDVVGAVADVALLELREGNFEFLDNYNNTIQGRQRLFQSGTILAGRPIRRG